MKFKLGIIGAGVMANAIIDKAIKEKVITPEDIIVYDIDETKLSLAQKKGMNVADSLQCLINNSEIVLFAVKPQHYSSILEKNDFNNVNTIISIMAGVKTSTIRKKLKGNCGVARVMPNTPCRVGKGFSGIYFDKVKEENRKFIIYIFSACGEILLIDESKFDSLTSISGSGPAYVYMFINAMIKGGINGGLSYEEAKKMVIATITGAATLAEKSDEKMDELIKKVCSKGGTTIEAINLYKEKGLENIIKEGIDACRNKSEKLSEKL